MCDEPVGGKAVAEEAGNVDGARGRSCMLKITRRKSLKLGRDRSYLLHCGLQAHCRDQFG